MLAGRVLVCHPGIHVGHKHEIDLDPELEDDVLAEWLLNFGKGSGR
jgi:hypothetical protein